MDPKLNPETIIYQQVLAMFMKNELAIEKLTKQITRNEKQLSDITDTLGKYVEEQVKPKAISEFKKFGIFLNESHFRVSDDENIGSQAYEIDLLLVNTDYAVAIECKSKLKIDDVDEHLKRLEKI